MNINRFFRVWTISSPGGATPALRSLPVFVPGLLFIMIGLAALVAPRLILALVATFFVFVGISFCLVAWKVISMQRRMREFFQKNFEVRAVVDPTVVPDIEWPSSSGLRGRDRSERKIIIH